MIRHGENNTLIFDREKIIFKNFSGKEGPYNAQGERSFSVIIEDPMVAQKLADEGWNIRILKSRDEDAEPNHRLPIKVTQRSRDGKGFTRLPSIFKHKNSTHVRLNENTVGDLDYDDIVETSFVVRGYQYEPGKISAWLNSMDVVIADDPFADRYGRPGDGFMNEPEPEDLPFS